MKTIKTKLRERERERERERAVGKNIYCSSVRTFSLNSTQWDNCPETTVVIDNTKTNIGQNTNIIKDRMGRKKLYNYESEDLLLLYSIRTAQ